MRSAFPGCSRSGPSTIATRHGWSVPRASAEELGEFVEAAARLEGVTYAYDVIGVEPGDRIAVGRDLTIEAFATDHVLPSLGYHLLRRRRHLRPELAGLAGDEIARRRAQGERVEVESEEVWLSYCGDTGAGVFDSAPRLAESRVLLIECTFLGATMRDRGARYGHLHLDDLAARADRLGGHDWILLHHLSRRHTVAQLRAEIERKLPELSQRVHILFEEAAP